MISIQCPICNEKPKFNGYLGDYDLLEVGYIGAQYICKISESHEYIADVNVNEDFLFDKNITEESITIYESKSQFIFFLSITNENYVEISPNNFLPSKGIRVNKKRGDLLSSAIVNRLLKLYSFS